MDTKELTNEAYRVLITKSEEISEHLMLEIAASARYYNDEDAYLNAMYESVQYFSDNPQSFLLKWDPLEKCEPDQFGVKLRRLAEEIFVVKNKHLNERNAIPN